MEDLRAPRSSPASTATPPCDGHPALRDAIVEHVRASAGISIERSQVLVTTGATGALGAHRRARSSLPARRSSCSRPTGRSSPASSRPSMACPWPCPSWSSAAPGELVEAVRARITERTVALYLNTPNNPSGRVLPRAWVEALAELARREGLWILSDEVYEDYVYEGEHVSTLALAPERTLATWSFSKAYGMAGNRCGWAAGPKDAVAQLRKVSTHSFYSAPTAAQLAGLRALQGPGTPGGPPRPPRNTPTPAEGRRAARSPSPAGQHLPLRGRLPAPGRARAPGLPGALCRAAPARGPGYPVRPLPSPRAALLHLLAAGHRPPRRRRARAAHGPLKHSATSAPSAAARVRPP